MNASSLEVDVDQLMSAIREAASKRHRNLDAFESMAFSRPQVTQTNYQPELTLSPEFSIRSDNTYHVNDLLKYHHRDFVSNAYRAILKREPDEAGFFHNLEMLQSGAFNKIDILASLRYSQEGKLNEVRVTGLRLPATIRAVERIPVVGYLLQILIAFARLPVMLRSQRQSQGYVVAQQLAIADHVNDMQRVVASDLERHSSALTNQLRAMSESVMSRILSERERLLHDEAQLLALADRLSTTEEQVKTIARNLADERKQTSDELREWDNLYAAFEEQFRGSSEEVEKRLRFYLPFLKDLKPHSSILDLGSGRGDWLELLSKQGFKPRGVEVNDVLAERSRKKGLEVSNIEMMVYLNQQPDDSLDLVTVFHLIEHFDFDKLISLLEEIKRTLKPGGLLFIETPNPENLVVGACNFYADPTHHKPIYPQTLMFLLRHKGFVDLYLKFLHPVDQSPFQGESEGSQQLNMWFFGPRDFSVIARKAHQEN